MKTLYELTDEFLEIERLIEEFHGEITEDVEILLDAIVNDIDNKAEGYARFMKNKEAEASMFEAEMKRLKHRRDAARKAANRAKERLYGAMIVMDRAKIETSIGTFKITMNGGQLPLVIDDERTFAEEYPDLVQDWKPVLNKEAIRFAVEHGDIPIEGVHILDRGTHLRFR